MKILTLSDSDTFRILKILTLSDSDTFRISKVLTLSGFWKFWHLLVLTHSDSNTVRFDMILTLSSFKEFWHIQVWHIKFLTPSGHKRFWHIQILTLFSSKIISYLEILTHSSFRKLWHYPVLTLSDSDTFMFLAKNQPQKDFFIYFYFWNFSQWNGYDWLLKNAKLYLCPSLPSERANQLISQLRIKSCCLLTVCSRYHGFRIVWMTSVHERSMYNPRYLNP